MKRKFLKPLIGLAMAATLMLAACDRDDKFGEGADTEEEQTLEESSTAEDASDDALEIAAQAEAQLAVNGGRVATDLCATITHDEAAKKVIIDFGDGCAGPYGRTRKGKILITYSSTLGDSIANRIITFENYFVNNKGIAGTIELRDLSVNATGNLQSTKRLSDLTVTFASGHQVVYNGSRTRERLAGGGDNNPYNNVYRITGTITGESTTGRSFTQEIVEPIIADWSCAAQGNFARVAGVVETTKLAGYSTRKRTVNYGDGDCDNIITITTVRRTYVVTVQQ